MSQSLLAMHAVQAAPQVAWRAVAQVVQSPHEPVSHGSTLLGAAPQ
jgi:hypothetical protein